MGTKKFVSILKLGQMLQGPMLPGQMSPRELTTNTDDLSDQPSKFGWVWTSNIRDMASYVLINYRDPNKNPKNPNKMQPQ